MARRRSNTGTRQAARNRRIAGSGTAAGAFVSFGLMPLIVAPPANADVLDTIVDPIINSLAALDPTLDGTNAAATEAALQASVQGLEQALATAMNSSPLAELFSTASSNPVTTDGFVQQYIYDPIHTGIEDWINSTAGQQVDAFINQFAPNGEIFIGNGADGTSAADPNGESVLWFGDGGNGWNSTEAGIPGGAGGSAGIIGDGGDGGEGGAGAFGGDGGNGGSLMGIGGNGGDGGAGASGGDGGNGGDAPGQLFGIAGNGGDGANATSDTGIGGNGGNAGDAAYNGPGVLPALGGAGGLGGDDGSHGAAGDYGTLAGGPPTAGTGGLTDTGTWITNSNGDVVIMHGLNEVMKVAPYEPSAEGFSTQDAQFLEDNGFNAVRLGVIWEAVEPEPGVFNDAYLANIAQTVQTLADHHIYVILDMHQDDYGSALGGEGAPAWATQTDGLPIPNPPNPESPAQYVAWGHFWSNSDASDGVGLEDNYAQTWEHVAAYFNGNPDIAGFEIMNEPYPLGVTQPFEQQVLTPFYNEVDSAIRAVDPTTPVYIEPDAADSLGTPINLGTVDDPNTVLSFHDYCSVILPSGGCYPDVTANTANALAYADAHNIPAYMTEFGATNSQALITPSLQSADQNDLSWTEWAFTGQNDITTTANPPSIESLVYNPADPPVGDNVNTANLATLAEPYPEQVAGTPGSYSFDNGTFQFTYSTAMVNGQGSFAPGSETTISVPSVEFPDGYAVSVTGGEVVSAPNAAELVIASNSGASTVSVTVTPAP